MLEKIKSTADFIRSKTSFNPEYGIVLGSGLGGLVQEVREEFSFEYSDIPNFPLSTVKGHGGKLILGTLAGKKVIAMQGRFHYYEGYSMQEVTFPIRVMIELGIRQLLLSNASGGMNPDYKVGDIVIIQDQINLMPSNPLIGKNEDELGPRFPDMSEAYESKSVQAAYEIASAAGYRVHKGVYAGVSGPCFETPAEYRFLRIIGADIVGMSTVPEVIVARHAGIPCFAISIVTDLGGFEHVEKISHEEVLRVANASEGKMTDVISQLLAKL
ncbi:MAG: purine-nucleoside phosphorylase [Bacteroidetes bacterium]|nr:MAG: purine-nucleoside phosphorylase [Bacteroidota bacterium]REK06445.1 MAG: purine-nucleoside phosphorylase [Bacteroidota bacterium]REK33211.1 MAG: purine-nucleoside phosphorylase [Bacteroidota bacterium]REK47048.1 MAG: purine-nucleoside phosphorylase [Bacteroidota bacterium]